MIPEKILNRVGILATAIDVWLAAFAIKGSLPTWAWWLVGCEVFLLICTIIKDSKL